MDAHLIVRDRPSDPKVSVPGASEDLIHRPRLVEILTKTQASLICVTAPAGYGKSIIAAQWLVTRNQPVAWLSLDRYDNDFLEFLLLGPIDPAQWH